MDGGDGPAPKTRNLGLDVARAAAIMMVLTSHIMTSSGLVTGVLVTAMDTLGQAGVELFFSLSGFLIGGILIRLAEDGVGWPGVLRFMARRWFRTLPLYYLMLIGMGLWLRMDIGHSLMLLQNFYPDEPRALPVSWSLVMEEYFYFFFPLLMVGLRALGLRRAGLVGAGAATLIVACSAIRLLNAYGYGFGWPATLVHESPLLRLDCAAYGAVAAWLNHTFGGAFNRSRARWGWAVLGLCTGLVMLNAMLLIWVLGADTKALVSAGFLRWGAAFLAMQPAGWEAGFAGVVLVLAHARLRMGKRIAGMVGGISLISYSIYLVHLPVIGEVDRHLAAADGPLRASLAAGFSVLIACITYHCVERPLLAMRDWVVPGR